MFEFNNIAELNQHMGLPAPKDPDFDVNSLESYDKYLLISDMPALLFQLDVELSVGYYKQKPQVPFGGFKQSGIERKFGKFGLMAYLEPKSVFRV